MPWDNCQILKKEKGDKNLRKLILSSINDNLFITNHKIKTKEKSLYVFLFNDIAAPKSIKPPQKKHIQNIEAQAYSNGTKSYCKLSHIKLEIYAQIGIDIYCSKSPITITTALIKTKTPSDFFVCII